MWYPGRPDPTTIAMLKQVLQGQHDILSAIAELAAAGGDKDKLAKLLMDVKAKTKALEDVLEPPTRKDL